MYTQQMVVSDYLSLVNVDVVVGKCKVSRLKIVYLLIERMFFSD